MKLSEIWTNFSERMAEIELFHRAAQDSAKKELLLINEYANSLNDNPELKDFPSLHNMTFYDARTGIIKVYNHKECSLEDRYLHVLLHKNKQYQWLLAEAYEEFKDYLENIYAYYGSINNAFWPLRDYGNISLSELGEKNYAWYSDQARKKKDITPHSILNRFRKQFPELRAIEATNKLQINLSLAITLIEKLRHVIVHEGGKVSSKKAFIKLTTKQSGLYNNGNISQEHVNLISLFFGENEYENLITLLEIRVQPEIPLGGYVNLFGKLTDYLMAYAFLIYEHIDSSITRENA